MISVTSLPVLPDRIHRLSELAYDLWWSWNPQAREVFRRLDYAVWRLTAHNPVRMLRILSSERLEEAAQDSTFLSVYDAAIRGLDKARSVSETWWAREFPDLTRCSIAYFSAEFALHQSLPIYAGGLGVLAGDHCKEASDLGVPLIGVGFMYPQGYFHQKVSSEGWQVELYERLNWDDAPVRRAANPLGEACVITVPLGNRNILVTVWSIQLGRVKLYLLDTDREENAPWDRELSARLYAGDRETRLRQEIILGVGGVRALRALGCDPQVWHLNEGHAAFVVLERLRELLERGEGFEEAVDQIRSTTVFTTHTPVPAGHDAFPFHLVEGHLEGSWEALGQHRGAFLELARYDNGGGPLFNMTALALRTSSAINAVSLLHQQVTNRMWGPIWPGVPDAERPVKALTNGIHIPTWIAPVIADLFDRYLGRNWREQNEDQNYWDQVLSIPDEELWAARQSLRGFLVAFIRERARQRWTEEQVSPAQVVVAGTLLDPAALTIGFARRFTGYKRPELIFHDSARLARILNAPRRPVQIIFAGKAHPVDDPGKHHLQHIYRRASDPAFGGRIAFVDDYDLHVAHFLVQGCDVWLNTPRRLLEASGTSGMKAAVNGVVHVSVAGGWWAEGYTGRNGWLIEGGTEKDDSAADAAEAESLYRLLEEAVVPAFYERDRQGVPRRWIQTVKESIRTVAPRFGATRMLKEYAREMYAPSARRGPKD
ncbi:MAG TPA: alpha-glucan family phosphorylase [Terriglobia bacterium]|jgi:starch phosphorylase|nr:alpha-glucan family phosphorylase [Terriglobia bacterium]